ncbi:MAG: helix-turn-helix transcriptional regulator [Micromonosporaceae bacterium]
MNRDELASFLRARRNGLRPTDVGLPDGGRRRTPGLRRQEVAQLAGISIEYYIRMEQARGPRPSKQVLGALGRALMLTADERDYLFRLAGEAPPPVQEPSRELAGGVRNLLATLAESPAYVVDATYEVLAVNRLAEFFVGNPLHRPEPERSLLRSQFGRSDDDPSWDNEHSVAFARASVADLRAAMARYPGSRRIQALITELLATSKRFARMWEEHHVAVRRGTVKRIDHPLAGPLEFEVQVLHVPDADQRILIYVAAPGSRTQEAFRELAALTVTGDGSLGCSGPSVPDAATADAAEHHVRR